MENEHLNSWSKELYKFVEWARILKPVEWSYEILQQLNLGIVNIQLLRHN
jgi:hypothetical protein